MCSRLSVPDAGLFVPRNSEQDFISVLCQADTTEPAALRAVRAYLDVCFFHPFDDGNSRHGDGGCVCLGN